MTTVFVHAHPDDETIYTGATMAHMVRSGERVVLVTCTRGERGEVIPLSLRHVEGDAAALGEYRARELAAACAALGVREYMFLGEAQGMRFEDSGMAWKGGVEGGTAIPAPDTPESALCRTDPDVLVRLLGDVLRSVDATRVVTYEPGGGYGHPDHVRVHEVTMATVREIAPEAEVWWAVQPEQLFRDQLRDLRQAGFRTIDPDGALPTGFVSGDSIDVEVSAPEVLAAKEAALAAHATQIMVDPPAFALSNALWQPLTPTEYYVRPGHKAQKNRRMFYKLRR